MVRVRRPGPGWNETGDRGPSYRIALVASSFHPYAGGVEEHVRQVARCLVEQGHDVEVWTVDRGEHLGSQRVDGIDVRYLATPLPARTLGAMASFAARAPFAVARWWRAHRRFRPDVLHVHCFGPNGVYADRLARATGTPLLLTGHGETFMDDENIFEKSALLNRSLRGALQRAARVTACSQAALDDLQLRFGLRGGVVVFNGVDLSLGQSLGQSLVQPARQEAAGRESPPVVFAVGRLERMKGFDLLLPVLDTGRLPSATRVVIGGDGAARADLVAEVRRRGLESRVTFTGRLSPEEVARSMAAASVVVVPSRREAFGIVALEAWRSGTPLVVTSHGGPSEFVRDEVDGLVVDPEDTDALADAIGRVLTDKELAGRLSEEGLRSVQRFTWPGVAENYLRLVSEVVA